MKGFSLRFRIESKLFNGYVMQPIPIVILWSIVGIAILALAISCSLEPLLEPSTPECSMTKCEFISYSGDGPSFVIRSNEDQVYYLPTDAIEDEHILESIIENKTAVKISYKLPPTKKSNACDIVEITNVDGSVIVSQEAISAANAKNYRNSLITMWSVCLVYWGFGIGGYCILCHAPEHPRLAGLLIRREFRNF